MRLDHGRTPSVGEGSGVPVPEGRIRPFWMQVVGGCVYVGLNLFVSDKYKTNEMGQLTAVAFPRT